MWPVGLAFKLLLFFLYIDGWSHNFGIRIILAPLQAVSLGKKKKKKISYGILLRRN